MANGKGRDVNVEVTKPRNTGETVPGVLPPPSTPPTGAPGMPTTNHPIPAPGQSIPAAQPVAPERTERLPGSPPSDRRR